MLEFLGRDTGFGNVHNSAFFRKGSRLVLLDCSMTVFEKAKELVTPETEAVDILVTHTHSDHISGVAMLCTWCFFEKHVPVTVVAPSEAVRGDLEFFMKRLDGLEDEWFRLISVENYKEPWFKAAIPTSHTPQLEGRCFGYCLEVEGRNVVYTGDTCTLKPFAPYLTEGTCFYTEASANRSGVHMYIDDILSFVGENLSENVEVFLMHLDDEEKILDKIKGTALKLAPLWEDKKMDTLEQIYDITDKLYKLTCQNEENDHSSIFGYLTELGKMITGSDRASFWKWDKRRHQLWTTAATGVDKIVIPENAGLVGKSLATKSVVITNDPYNDPDFNSAVDKKTGYVTKSVMVLPVADVNGEFIGAFQLINKLDGTGFDAVSDGRKLSLPALICGLALESDTFLDDSQHDRLTKLKNRIGFYADFSHKYMKYLDGTSDSPMSMFICDIDKFKLVNDTYGHNAGDQVLEHAANLLQDACRENDNVYRWGGEEFIMLMPDTTLEEAVEVAEKLRLTIAASEFPADGITIHKTMSFGVHQFVPGCSIEENVSAADQHLYTAKETGRNKVVYS